MSVKGFMIQKQLDEDLALEKQFFFSYCSIGWFEKKYPKKKFFVMSVFFSSRGSTLSMH